jgi:hypothetical protein
MQRNFVWRDRLKLIPAVQSLALPELVMLGLTSSECLVDWAVKWRGDQESVTEGTVLQPACICLISSLR